MNKKSKIKKIKENIGEDMEQQRVNKVKKTKKYELDDQNRQMEDEDLSNNLPQSFLLTHTFLQIDGIEFDQDSKPIYSASFRSNIEGKTINKKLTSQQIARIELILKEDVSLNFMRQCLRLASPDIKQLQNQMQEQFRQ